MRLASPLLIAAAVLAVSTSPARAAVAVPAEANGPYSVKVLSFREIPFRSVVRQQFDYSCGSAATATLMKFHYGRPVVEADIFAAMWKTGDQATIRRVGFSMLDMKAYLDGVGLKADGYKMTLDELAEENAPAIALINLGRYRHFVVIKGVHGDRVLVGDPALGIKVFRRSDFEKIWNGIVLLVHGDTLKRQPVFNDPAEWRPWARSPLHLASGTLSPGDLTRGYAPLDQVTMPQRIPGPAQ